jgi:pyrimidine and pyridine-specific 5'-nucleotidase
MTHSIFGYHKVGDHHLRSQVQLTREEYEQKISVALKQNAQNLQELNHEGSQIKLTYDIEENRPAPPLSSPDSKIFFFDIDNCLYKRSTKIHDLMQIYIHEYLKQNLQVNDEDAHRVCEKYYQQYGLAIQGLVKFHQIEGLEYNEKVDDALPLQNILKPDPELRQLLIKLKESGKVERLWLFTNAYKNHGKRVVQLLGIADLFDGLTYCDYSQTDLVCKPSVKMFNKALREANGGNSFENHYFIDDSVANIQTSTSLGFAKSIHFAERDEDLGKTPEGAILVRDILDLPKVIPELF